MIDDASRNLDEWLGLVQLEVSLLCSLKQFLSPRGCKKQRVCHASKLEAAIHSSFKLSADDGLLDGFIKNFVGSDRFIHQRLRLRYGLRFAFWRILSRNRSSASKEVISFA